jgi:hypothetical protein
MLDLEEPDIGQVRRVPDVASHIEGRWAGHQEWGRKQEESGSPSERHGGLHGSHSADRRIRGYKKTYIPL